MSWRVVESLMGGWKSNVFIQCSWILGGESDGLEGLNWGSVSNAWLITQDWYSYHTSLTPRPWEIVTCSDPREQRSSCAPRGIPLAKPAWVWFACQWANLSGIAGNLPCTRSSPPSKWAASSGSEVHGSSGTCRICSSSSGSGVGETGAGAMGSFSATSNISRLRRPSPSRRGARHLWSSCTTPHSTPGAIPNWTTQLWRAMARWSSHPSSPPGSHGFF